MTFTQFHPQTTGGQQGYYPPPPTGTEETDPDQSREGPEVNTGDVLGELQQELRRIVGQWATQAGYSANAGQAIVNQAWSGFLRHLGNTMGGTFQRMGPDTLDIFQVGLHLGIQYFGARLPFSVPEQRGGGGGGGGGRGPRGPTAAEIRAQFDLDELADSVNSLSQMFLIQDHSDPRSVARQYVEAVVKNPDQKLDFQTFVKGQLKKDPRWNIIMRNKPNGQDEAQYIQRYAQQVMGTLGGGDESSQIAFEQAALGSSAEGVQARLGRTRSARASSDFINSFEDTIRGVSDLLR